MALAGDLQAIVHRLNRENARAAARVADAQREAYRAARELAVRMGTEDASVRQVILFGSTLPGRRYRNDSDIDFAVEGGDRALLERLAADGPRTVDIIGIDELRPGIRDRVLAEGEVLYEAK
ncbi:MAG: nucleotidyltransferase domain-containing protein [Alkalispirochaeta sp.]